MASDKETRTLLHVGDLHPEVTEKEIADTFSGVGPVRSVILCRDKFTGNSRGFAYVNFWVPFDAISALKSLNHTKLRGKCIRITWYEPSARRNNEGMGNIFVKNLDKSITSARLETIFSRYGTILSCKVVEDNGISKGFGFVQFDSDESAIAAIAGLHDTELEGNRLSVSKKTQRKAARIHPSHQASSSVSVITIPELDDFSDEVFHCY